MLNLQGKSADMDRVRSTYGTEYMSMLETEEREVPNMPFIEILVREYSLTVTVGKQTFSPESDCTPYCTLPFDYFGSDDDEDDDDY